MDHALCRTESSEWNDYAINVDGVSLVTTCRFCYQRMAKSEGLDALIWDLAAGDDGDPDGGVPSYRHRGIPAIQHNVDLLGVIAP